MFRRENGLVKGLIREAGNISSLEYTKSIDMAIEKIEDFFRDKGEKGVDDMRKHILFLERNNYDRKEIKVARVCNIILSNMMSAYISYQNIERALENYNRKENDLIYDVLRPYLA